MTRSMFSFALNEALPEDEENYRSVK
jgi:hypothetical protein